MDKDHNGNTRWLPSGMVTFVFTDIEGSTRLYKALGQQCAEQVFDTHNEILRAAWQQFDGHEVHTEGDSFFVVFEDPAAAVDACVQVQRCLAETVWPAGGEVRVRIGIHRGLAAPRHDDYMALSVHQAARVMSAASGDQIVITDAVADELDASDDFAIERAGTFRLRDFDDAPVLHRVVDQRRQSNDQPLRATPAKHHNLVPRLNSFVGRDADVEAVNDLLEPGRAVTVVGLGGLGKTRLATEIGLAFADRWIDGVWMVELAEAAISLIAEKVAESIGAPADAQSDRWADVLDFVGDRSMLIILDNAEHVLVETSSMVTDLLRRCPGVALLITSREPLYCQGEVVHRLQPLGRTSNEPHQSHGPSVHLFVDRARLVSATFDPDDAEVELITQICHHLDGVPLAIEIAAAQVSMLQLHEILDGLGNRFRLLRSRDRSLPDRHRTMEGLLGWSHHLLRNDERRAFRRLAVFGGSFSIDAAIAAIGSGDIDPDDVPELVWTLVDKSLVAADTSESATRYRLLESVQHYAMGLLMDTDDAMATAVLLARWLLERAAPWHTHDRKWLGEVSIELANIRHVVDLVSSTEPEIAQQLMCSVAAHHDAVQSYRTGVGEIVRAARANMAQTQSRVALLVALAGLHLRTGDLGAALSVVDQADSLQRAVGAPEWDRAGVVRCRGEIAVREHAFERAIDLAEEALRNGLPARDAAGLWSLSGIAHASMGNFDEGLPALQQALDCYVELRNDIRINIARGNVAEAAWRLGEFDRAAMNQAQCLDDAVALGQPVIVAYSLIMAGRLAETDGELDRALRLHSCGQHMLVQAGHSPYQDELDAFERLKDQTSAELGVEKAEQLIEDGRATSAVTAADLARSVLLTHCDPHPQFARQ